MTCEKSFGDVGDASRGLVRLPCQEHRSLIWVVTQPGAAIDVRDYLGPEMDHVLSSYALDGYVHQHTLNYEEPANWKIILEASAKVMKPLLRQRWPQAPAAAHVLK